MTIDQTTAAVHFHAGNNDPGYLPDELPATFATWDEARRDIIGELLRHADSVASWNEAHDCDDCPCPVYGDDCPESKASDLATLAEELNLDNGPDWSTVTAGRSYWIHSCSCTMGAAELEDEPEDEPEPEDQAPAASYRVYVAGGSVDSVCAGPDAVAAQLLLARRDQGYSADQDDMPGWSEWQAGVLTDVADGAPMAPLTCWGRIVVEGPASEPEPEARARTIAGDWHSGQASALYAFSSTGTILPELAGEVRTCRGEVLAHVGNYTQDEIRDLLFLGDFLDAAAPAPATTAPDLAELEARALARKPRPEAPKITRAHFVFWPTSSPTCGPMTRRRTLNTWPSASPMPWPTRTRASAATASSLPPRSDDPNRRNTMPTIPEPAALDFADLADTLEAALESGLAERVAMALNTWKVATAETGDDAYDFLRAASSAGRVIDALDRFGATFGAPDLGARLV